MKYVISFFVVILTLASSCTAKDPFEDKYNRAINEHSADLPWSNEVSKELIPYLIKKLNHANGQIDIIYSTSMLGHIITKNNTDITKEEERSVVEIIKKLPITHLYFNEFNSLEITIFKSFKGNSAFKEMAVDLQNTKDAHLKYAINEYLQSLSK